MVSQIKKRYLIVKMVSRKTYRKMNEKFYRFFGNNNLSQQSSDLGVGTAWRIVERVSEESRLSEKIRVHTVG